MRPHPLHTVPRTKTASRPRAVALLAVQNLRPTTMLTHRPKLIAVLNTIHSPNNHPSGQENLLLVYLIQCQQRQQQQQQGIVRGKAEHLAVPVATAVVNAVLSPLPVESPWTARLAGHESTPQTNTAELRRRMVSATARGHSTVIRTCWHRGQPYGPKQSVRQASVGSKFGTGWSSNIQGRCEFGSQEGYIDFFNLFIFTLLRTTSRWNRQAILCPDLKPRIGNQRGRSYRRRASGTSGRFLASVVYSKKVKFSRRECPFDAGYFEYGGQQRQYRVSEIEGDTGSLVKT